MDNKELLFVSILFGIGILYLIYSESEKELLRLQQRTQSESNGTTSHNVSRRTTRTIQTTGSTSKGNNNERTSSVDGVLYCAIPNGYYTIHYGMKPSIIPKTSQWRFNLKYERILNLLAFGKGSIIRVVFNRQQNSTYFVNDMYLPGAQSILIPDPHFDTLIFHPI
jgi:hypothetical protein